MPVQKSTSPGTISQERLNYGLHENVVSIDIRDEVRANRQMVQEHFTEDILGVRGPQWDSSVRTFPGKSSRTTSDQTLTNTLTTTHITPNDLRKTSGSTHCRADQVAATSMSRNQLVGSWNASTYFERAELIKKEEAVTNQSIRATQALRPGLLVHGYVSPQERSAAVTLRVREAKSCGDGQELERLYGHEGAEAMRETMKLSTYGRSPPLHHRSRTTPEDLAAVHALPEYHDTRPSGTPDSRGLSPDNGANENIALGNDESSNGQAPPMAA